MSIRYGAALRAAPPARLSSSRFRDLNEWWRMRSRKGGHHWVARDGMGVGPVDARHAIKCRVCGKGRAPEGGDCPYCGATVRSVLGQGAPLPASVVAELAEDRRLRKLRLEACIRRRLRSHAFVGGLIFAFCGVLSAAGAFCLFMIHEMAKVYFVGNTVGCRPDAAGGAETAVPDLYGIFMGMTLAFLLASCLGPVAGYVVSHQRSGVRFGALVGACAFGLCIVLLNPASVLSGSSRWVWLVILTIIGSLPGMVAGILLGWHVSSEPL